MSNKKAPLKGQKPAQVSPNIDSKKANQLTREERLAQALRDNLRRRKVPKPTD